ncbi:MAG: hypothetical protein JKY37_31515 [Nannocystaceae bacterium]|nr:hypothetical protein [Nannocystaceae bacterium]
MTDVHAKGMSDEARVEEVEALPEIESLSITQTDPRARGQSHGEHWRACVHELAEVQLSHACVSAETDAVLDSAAASLVVMAAEVPDLHAEILGIAEGADLTPQRIVVLNGVDLAPVDEELAVPSAAASGGTSIYFQGAEGPTLGHIWDLHPAVAPFVRVLRVKTAHVTTLLVTLTGCLGLAGLTDGGFAVTTLALSQQDRAVGVPWPAVVRSLLAAGRAADARRDLERLTLGSGRHVVLADREQFLALENSATHTVLTQKGPKAAHLHTNHSFDPVLRQTEAIPRTSTTFPRINTASTIYAQQRPATADALWALLHEHGPGAGSLCSHGGQGASPQQPVTAAIAVFSLAPARLRIVAGCEQRGRSVSLDVGAA